MRTRPVHIRRRLGRMHSMEPDYKPLREKLRRLKHAEVDVEPAPVPDWGYGQWR